MKCQMFSASLTLLTRDEELLHREGMRRHLEDQWDAGLAGVLVAGSMGLFQLLRDEAFEELVPLSVELSRGRGRLLVGAGDTSFARTRARIDFLNNFELDGVVLVAPYFVPFSQDQLADYFSALAGHSRNPVYLYDVPVRIGVRLETPLVERLSAHPNIHGIKSSTDLPSTRQLVERLGDRLEIIVSQVLLADYLMRVGYTGHLDGLYAIAPHWAQEQADAAERGDWAAVEEVQARFPRLLEALVPTGIFPGCEAILNARGMEGTCAPRPYAPLSREAGEALLSAPIVRKLLDVAVAAPG